MHGLKLLSQTDTLRNVFLMQLSLIRSHRMLFSLTPTGNIKAPFSETLIFLIMLNQYNV